MKFTQFLKEEKLPTSFEDSGDATNYIDDIFDRMSSKAVLSWARDTDTNFNVKSKLKLNAAISAFNAFIEELQKADE